MSKFNIDIWMRPALQSKFVQCDPTGIKILEHRSKLKCDILMPALFVDSSLRQEEIEAEYKEFTINKILSQLNDGVDKEEYKKNLEEILCVSTVHKVRDCVARKIVLKDL